MKARAEAQLGATKVACHIADCGKKDQNICHWSFPAGPDYLSPELSDNDNTGLIGGLLMYFTVAEGFFGCC